MRLLPKIITRLSGSNRGASAVEYGLILALITLAVIGAMKGVAGGSSSLWSNISQKAENAM